VYTTAGITDTRQFEFQLMENNASNCRGIFSVKRLLHLVSLCAIGVLIFDVGIYLLAPRSLTAALPGYKKPMVPGSNARAGNAFYPQDYFVADAQTGFDIGFNRRAEHFVPEFGSYPVWSNGIGCFDDDIAVDTDISKSIYLAGDSFAWGYAPYEAKFGTLLKKRTDARVLSCGVSHSGQLHQFIKFQRNVESLNAYPSIAVVNVSYNNIENDYAFPHTTVVDGWQVDTARVSGDGSIVLRQLDDIRDEMQKIMADAESPSLKFRVQRFIGHYSASAQIVNAMKQRFDAWFAADQAPSNDTLGHIYTLFRGSDVHQFDTSFADRNREALLTWQQDAKRNNYRLVIALIPPARQLSDQTYYSALRQFLAAHDFEYYEFSRSRVVMDNAAAAMTYYWQFDPHFSIEGNAAYAEFLVESLGL
jgi:hypothetical protein